MTKATRYGMLALAFLLVGAANAQAPAAKTQAQVDAFIAKARAAVPKSAIDFNSVDANSDGAVAHDEVNFVDDLREAFAKLDVNQDGKLTPGEFARWERAGNTEDAQPLDPSTGPSGSRGAQHMPSQR